jgi:hypothetical protein
MSRLMPPKTTRPARETDAPLRRRLIIATPEYLRAELARYEQRYGMSSEEFLRRVASGELDDHDDFFRWESLCAFAIQQRLLSAPPEWKALW